MRVADAAWLRERYGTLDLGGMLLEAETLHADLGPYRYLWHMMSDSLFEALEGETPCSVGSGHYSSPPCV